MKDLLANIDSVLFNLRGRKLVIILDFDGTITGVRRDFEKVTLSKRMISSLQKLSSLSDVKLLVLTGRTRDFIRDKVPVDGVEIIAERGVFLTEDYRKSKRELEAELKSIINILQPVARKYRASIEFKEASVVFHVRKVSAANRDLALSEAVKETVNSIKLLKPVYGRMTVEFLPPHLPDKGETINIIMERFGSDCFFIYVGDDAADEPAFREVNKNGFGVLVKSREKDYRKSFAKYSLSGVSDVRVFLDKLYSVKSK